MKKRPSKKSPSPDSLTLPGIPKKRGRPVTGKALTNAERQAAYRERMTAEKICPCCKQKLNQ